MQIYNSAIFGGSLLQIFSILVTYSGRVGMLNIMGESTMIYNLFRNYQECMDGKPFDQISETYP